MLLHWSPSCPEGNETLEQFLKLNKSDLPISFYTSSIIIREANNTFHDRSDLSPTRRTRPPVWEPLPIRRAQCPPKALNPEPSDTSLTSPGQLATGYFVFFYFLLNNLKYMVIKTKPSRQHRNMFRGVTVIMNWVKSRLCEQTLASGLASVVSLLLTLRLKLQEFEFKMLKSPNY